MLTFYKTFILTAITLVSITSLSARGGEFRGDDEFRNQQHPQYQNRSVYNTQGRINQTPGARGVEDAALMNRGLENGAGGGTVYQQAPAQPNYPTAPAPQTPY